MRRTLGRFGIVVHGGAGVPDAIGARRQLQFRQAIERSLVRAHAILRAGGGALDAVAAAVVVLEDHPLFDAGRGAVFNAQGEHELDAAIMDGATRAAGAVAAVKRTKNPVLAARAVMETTPHVMLVGAAADRFAGRHGIPIMPNAYFSTDACRRALTQERSRAQRAGAGTVGAVALDRHGNLAAATSTGGYTNKMAGRVGDSPVIGASTYADNATCAASATGYGEFFMRAVVCHDIAARMRYAGATVQAAARAALGEVARLGGSGGVIALDARGRFAMPYNTPGMVRGYALEDGTMATAVYGFGV